MPVSSMDANVCRREKGCERVSQVISIHERNAEGELVFFIRASREA